MKKKIFVSIFMAIILLLSFGNVVANAEAISESAKSSELDKVCQQVINDMVAAENTQNWDAYYSLFTKDRAEELKAYFMSKSEKGIKNVQSAKLEEVQFVDPDIVSSVLPEINNKARNYLIGVRYNVKNENRYYIDGVNYLLISLVLDGDDWRIDEYQEAPLENFISYNTISTNRVSDITTALPNLNPDNINIILAVKEARTHGIIVNAKGEFIESTNPKVKNAADAKELLIEAKQDSAIVAAARTRPTVISVYVKRDALGPGEYEFLPYTKRVLPKEWKSSWPAQSLRAGGLVVMQYAAYHIFYNARHPQEGCDVCDESHCQVFGPYGCNTTATDSAINYVDDYYYETSGGTFFETCYAAGNENSDYGHSGRMRQNGSKYWADQGKTWTWMMDYYYSDSDYNIPITTIVRKSWS